MQDILELERRIAAAFDRIDRGLEQADRARMSDSAPQFTLGPDAGPTDLADALRRDLEAAQASNADWAKRYDVLEAQLAEASRSMTDQIAKLTEELATTSAELKLALSTSATDPNAPSERHAMQDKLTELSLQMAAQSVELTQLRSHRATDIEELKSIVAALTPLIEEANPHA